MPNAPVRCAASPLASALGLPEPALTAFLLGTALTALLLESALAAEVLETAPTAGLPDAGAPTGGSDNWLSGPCAAGAAAERLGTTADAAPPCVLPYTNNRSIVSLPPELSDSIMRGLYGSPTSCNLQGQVTRLSQRVELHWVETTSHLTSSHSCHLRWQSQL